MAYDFEKLIIVLQSSDIGMWKKNHNEQKIMVNTRFVSTQNLLREFRERIGISVQKGLVRKIKSAQMFC